MIFDSNSSPVCFDHHAESLLRILPAQGVYYTKPSMMPQTNATFEKDIKACQAKSELAWILFLKALSRVASRNPKASPVTSNCPAGSAFKPTRLSQARCQLQMGCLHFTYWPLTFGYDIMGPVLTGVNRSCENREDVHGLLTIRTYKKWINGTDGALQVRLCS